MNWKRFFGAIMTAFALVIILDILLNAVLLRGAWNASAQCWLPLHEMNRRVPLGWLAILLAVSCQSVIFVRARWQGILRGLEFGFWLGMAAFVGVAIGIYSVVSWSMQLILAMATQQLMNSLLTGLALGWLYRPPASRGLAAE